ncbi:hypothetical protein EV586_106134 [Tumebacillus sp. BK434]|uniref:hypothetical protein n=1 Tax=Tumebacillus sp. BK434 TaxID=2512169 RepID=UPI001045D2ED|nr:hypothetical protein [Tumebacillus sp. BK434]TCP53386.1 hypothetical protein EV586_106134 [Tumebacillus sp. BK434]
MRGHETKAATRSVAQRVPKSSARRTIQEGEANRILQMQKVYGNQSVGRLMTQYRHAVVQRMQGHASAGSNGSSSIAQIQPLVLEGVHSNKGATLTLSVKGNQVKSIWSRGIESHEGCVTFGIRDNVPIITWVQASPPGQGVGAALMYFAAMACQQASVNSIFVDNVIDSARKYYEELSFTAYTRRDENGVETYISDTDMIGDTASVLSTSELKFQKGWRQRRGDKKKCNIQ